MSGNLRFSLSPDSGGPVQSKPYTCGAASLLMCHVVARTGRGTDMVREAHECSTDPVTGLETCFAAAEIAMIKRTNAVYRADRGWALPWPTQLGTSPWGAQRELESLTHGRPYAITVCRWKDRTWASAQLATLEPGFPTLLYVGSPTLPRHVTMICRDERTGNVVRYDPALGSITVLNVADEDPWDFPVAGWSHPWALIHPRERTSSLSHRPHLLQGGPSSVAPEGA